MTNYIIEDYRDLSEFKGCSFNNIKNTEIKKELIKCLIENNIDQSLYWCVEIITSCNFILLWEIFFYMLTNIINVSNVKFILFLDKKYKIFKEIINNCKNEEHVLNLRNNITIRNLFCDVIILICKSDKDYILDYKRINIKNFSFETMNNHLKAPNIKFVNDYFKDNDPKELYIILNEFLYNLSENNNLECCKWIYIYINYYSLCKKNKNILLCEDRDNIDLDSEYNKTLKQHPIWIIWSILFDKSKNDIVLNKYIKILYNFFKIQISISKIKSRLSLLFLSISLYVKRNSNDIFNKSIIKDKKDFLKLSEIARSSLDSIYKKVNGIYKNNPDNKNRIINNDKKNKISISFDKIKSLDNFMLNKNNDTN